MSQAEDFAEVVKENHAVPDVLDVDVFRANDIDWFSVNYNSQGFLQVDNIFFKDGSTYSKGGYVDNTMQEGYYENIPSENSPDLNFFERWEVKRLLKNYMSARQEYLEWKHRVFVLDSSDMARKQNRMMNRFEDEMADCCDELLNEYGYDTGVEHHVGNYIFFIRDPEDITHVKDAIVIAIK